MMHAQNKNVKNFEKHFQICAKNVKLSEMLAKFQRLDLDILCRLQTKNCTCPKCLQTNTGTEL